MGTSLLQSLGPDAAVIALKGRNIIAQVVRPGFGVFLHIPACKVGTMSDQTIPPYPPRLFLLRNLLSFSL